MKRALRSALRGTASPVIVRGRRSAPRISDASNLNSVRYLPPPSSSWRTKFSSDPLGRRCFCPKSLVESRHRAWPFFAPQFGENHGGDCGDRFFVLSCAAAAAAAAAATAAALAGGDSVGGGGEARTEYRGERRFKDVYYLAYKAPTLGSGESPCCNLYAHTPAPVSAVDS